MTRDFSDRRRRVGTLILVIALHAGVLLAVLNAKGVVTLPPEVARRLISFDVVVPPPPEPPPPPPPPAAEVELADAPKPAEPEGASAPPAKMAQATPIKVVVPKVVLPVQVPVAAAPTPATGTQPSSGAAPVAGPGTGAGGTGIGTGSGAFGSGSGGGGLGGNGAGRGTPPRMISGNITRRDYPRELRGSQVPIETINLQFTIGTDGYVRECKILKSSGSALLDQRTCLLYESRYRYQPARDAAGRPEQVIVRATRSWFIVGRGQPR